MQLPGEHPSRSGIVAIALTAPLGTVALTGGLLGTLGLRRRRRGRSWLDSLGRRLGGGDFGDRRLMHPTGGLGLCSGLALGLGRRFGFPLQPGFFLGTPGLGLTPLRLLGLLLAPRLFELAQGIGALIGLFVADLGALDIGALGPNLDRDRGLGLSGRDRDFLDLAALEGDPLGR